MIADDLSRIAMSSNLSAALARGADLARQQGHYEVTLEHMLLSLSDDPDAGLVLAASNIDLARLQTEVVNYLGTLERMPHGQDGVPGVSGDLRRILDAAAAAARGGKRREINGAIVLAAIVGDGKSVAAHMLRDQGLTFEGAIRALQRKPAGRAAHTSAEDILADARARVQSRTAPPRQLEHHEPDEEDEDEEEIEPEPAPSPAPAKRAPVQLEREEPPEQAVIAPPPPDAVSHTPAPQPEPPPRRERLSDRLEQHVEPRHEAWPEQEAMPPEPPSAPHDEWDMPAPSYADEGGISSLDDDLDGYAVEEEAGPPEMPQSAPFPPPLRVPEPSWMPEPGTEMPPPPPPGHGAPQPPPSFGAPPPLPPADDFGAASAPPPPPSPAAPPWPHPDEQFRGPPPGAPGERSAGDMGGPLMSRTRGMQPPGARPPAQGNYGRSGPAPRAEIGQLVENIPRIMRVSVPALVEVRIARADVQSLAEGLQGGGAAFHHKVSITKAMSVRLRAPDGGFFIETASPETQWIEASALVSGEDYASWRWHVTPRAKGRKRLQLVISARTVGADGLTAETALPDQVITVRVRTNYGKTAARWIGWVVAAIAGGLLARFGEGAFDQAKDILTKLLAN